MIMYQIYRYEKKDTRIKSQDILRDNKNIPPLFMLRSSELKINAIRAALKSPALFNVDEDDIIRMGCQLEELMNSYKNREIPLVVYYSRLGALLIEVNALRGITIEPETI
jgi:hypothetical protein